MEGMTVSVGDRRQRQIGFWDPGQHQSVGVGVYTIDPDAGCRGITIDDELAFGLVGVGEIPSFETARAKFDWAWILDIKGHHPFHRGVEALPHFFPDALKNFVGVGDPFGNFVGLEEFLEADFVRDFDWAGKHVVGDSSEATAHPRKVPLPLIGVHQGIRPALEDVAEIIESQRLRLVEIVHVLLEEIAVEDGIPQEMNVIPEIAVLVAWKVVRLVHELDDVPVQMLHVILFAEVSRLDGVG